MPRTRAQICWAVGGLLPALLLACPAPAFAADAPGSAAAQPVEIARSRYRQGVEAYRSGRYRESIDYFLEADRAAPSAALSFNIALAYEKIDDAAAALRWYRDYLRRAPDSKDRASVEASIQGYEARLAAKGLQQVTIFSEPSAATLILDGKPVGVTPYTTEIAPGSHRIELRHDGYENTQQTMNVPRDHASDVQVTLKAATDAPPVAAPAAPVAPSPAPAPAPAADHEPDSSGKTFTTIGIVGLAAGGAALGGALTFELLRRGTESDAEGDRIQVSYADKVETMESQQTVARVLLGTGAVLAAAGGVFLYLGLQHKSDDGANVGFACAPGGCMSTVRGRF